MSTAATEPLELTDAERAALIRLLRQTLDYARFPLAPRLDPLKAILAKVDPSKPRPERPPPLPVAGAPPTHGRYRKRR